MAAAPQYLFLTGDPQPVKASATDRRYWVVPSAKQAAKALPELLDLAHRIANLNPAAGEIGAGMLASLVADARAAVRKAEGGAP